MPKVSNYNFLCDLEYEIDTVSRSKFPGMEDGLVALFEEVGELCQALNQQKHEGKSTSSDVYKEAVQVAAMAMRIATEGLPEYPLYDPVKGYQCEPTKTS